MNAVAPIAVENRRTGSSAVFALRERLDQLMRVVLTLPAESYCARPSRVSGSIGEHVRHVLDHISSLVGASQLAVLSYDHRTRGTAVETQPGDAVREMMRLDRALERWLVSRPQWRKRGRRDKCSRRICWKRPTARSPAS